MGNSSSGQIDLAIITSLVSPQLPASMARGFFCALDENQDGHVDFKELACGVSAACRGPEMERQKCNNYFLYSTHEIFFFQSVLKYLILMVTAS